jgi:hypothetical protein
MVQDLMCLVYGKPCTSTLTQVKREDDQPYLNTPDDGRRLWREVYEPTFGRTSGNFGDSPDDALDRYKDQPLFYLDDVDSDKLAGWMDEWDQWSRPTWIAVTTMFQRGTTVEAQLLQLGVALESLGYALWRRRNPDLCGSRAPSFPSLLRIVTDTVGVEHLKLYGQDSASTWRTRFNTAFKGAKHADNPLPDGLEALELATQAMNVIRAWLAVQLGVPTERLLAQLATR